MYADLVTHTSLDYTSFGPAVKTTEPFVNENANLDTPFRVKKGAHRIGAAWYCPNHAEVKSDD